MFLSPAPILGTVYALILVRPMTASKMIRSHGSVSSCSCPDLSTAFEDGAAGFFEKPYEIDALLAAVGNALKP